MEPKIAKLRQITTMMKRLIIFRYQSKGEMVTYLTEASVIL